jgi:ribosomal protein S18 acetylase RimI-like enzyme
MTVTAQAAAELRRAISDRLDLFNVATTGLDAWHSVTVVLHGPDDELAGGLLGEIWAGWLHVTYLWIAAPYRAHRYGSDLLRAAERFAVEHGCHSARLETFSFQAPGFYQKLGYEVFATIDDYPPGHRHLFLRRALLRDRATRRSAKPRTS